MTLVKFFQKESSQSLGRLLSFAILAGMSNAVVLAIINAGAEAAANEEANLRLFLLFGIAMALYSITQRHVLRAANVQSEEIINRIRIRLADKIRNADLLPLEKIGRSEIYASVNRETTTISQAALQITIASQAGILVFFAVLYLAYLSKTAFALTFILTGIALLIHFRKLREFNRVLHLSTHQENELFSGLTHLLDGFKEVKMHEPRSRDLFRHLKEISHSVARLKTETAQQFASHYVFIQATFYVLLAGVVFILPRLGTHYTEIVTKAAATVLFIIGPLSAFIGAIPMYTQASVAIENIMTLESHLDHLQQTSREAVVKPRQDLEFEGEISFHEVAFEYKDQQGTPTFTLGPVDMKIRKGEILFVVGGNGSGKSTLLKLLTALYFPDRGKIRLDGRNLDQLHLQDYRNLFSAIYSDYHLFDRLFGMAQVDDIRVEKLLELMELEDKTRWAEGRFENQDLSTGQKKRLALLVTILEDRPIYLFDEWAADQDPGFRKYFYERFLKDLQKQGKTIIAATHDDHYFHVADRVLKMEYGKFVPYEAQPGQA